MKIPTQLRDSVGGSAAIETEGTTIGDCLERLFAEHPALKERICDESGLRWFVNVYVDGEDIRFLDGLETSSEGVSEITILPAVAGG